MPKLSIDATSKRDQAYRALRRLLVLQQLQPGLRIREPEWAQRLGVHRSALREAFARLEAEGLIERGAQTGYFVPELTPQDVQEITRLRLALESLAVDEICESEGQNQELAARLAPMAAACEELEQFLERGYSLGVVEADRRFHEALIDAAQSRRLSMLYNRAPLPLIHRHIEDHLVWQKLCNTTRIEHRQILAALRRRDARQTKALLRKHLARRSMVPICH